MNDFILRRFFFITFISFLILSACDESSSITTPPQTLQNVKVENIINGSIITYDNLNKDEILLVTVEYSTPDGGLEIVRFDVKDHESSLTLKGFSNEKHIIELYVVDYDGNSSSSVEVEIYPLISEALGYINTVIESTTISSIPGGISLSFKKNDQEKLLDFTLFYKEDSKWVEFITHSSDMRSETLKIRDLPYEDIQLIITDTESMEKTLGKFYEVTPLIEVQLASTLWDVAKLPSDNWEQGVSESYGYFGVKNLWGGYPGQENVRYVGKSAPFPWWFTIDLGDGQSLKLSKMIYHRYYHKHSGETNLYKYKDPKDFEIWGSNDPNPDGSFDGWEKIVEYSVIKPSGLPGTQYTDDDLIYAKTPVEIYFPIDKIKAYRYIRYKILNTWEVIDSRLMGRIHMEKFEFWGVE